MIKIRDNSNGYYYGDGSNWDSVKDYGNEFVNVYFRIDAAYYQYPFTGYTEEEQKEFDVEVTEMFLRLGWTVKERDSFGSCMTAHNAKQHLYLHPQSFSGEVLKNDIVKIIEVLENKKTFKLNRVDLYDTVYDITDQEYEQYLTTRDEEIRTAIFNVCQTKRTNKYYYVTDVARKLSNQFRLKRVGLNDGINHGTGQTAEHITKIIYDMFEKGYLVCAKGSSEDVLVRSINKTEQKKRKIFVAKKGAKIWQDF